jgi:phosphoribosylglycinamide formyltransferase-1
MNKGRVAVFLSGRGSNFTALARAAQNADANFSICLVISDRKDAPGLKKAARFKIPAFHIDPKQFPGKSAYEIEICNYLRREKIELICLAGYMRLVGPVLLDNYPGRIMNIHPALLPSFPGVDGYGDTYHYGCKVGGCTVHFVDYGEDSGPIIGQRAVAIAPGDSLETFKQKGLAEEWKLYPHCIELYAQGKLKVVASAKRRVVAIAP